MDKQQAQDIVRETFESPFDKGRFIGFVKNLLNHIDESKSFPKHLTGSYIKESFRERIKSYDRIGRFIDASGKVIDILTVCLHREKSIAQARTSQRNFISGYLRGDYGSSSSKDAAIVAFYCDDTTDWRFSLVTIDHVIDVEKLKVRQEFSSAKRFSFLVGENESSHTAQTQLLPLLDDKKIPTLDEIEKSFSIEKVTKEFYTEIAKKFTELVGGERKNGSKKIVEAGLLKYPKPDDTLRKEFAVRLIGRLMFSWFLKKKKSDAGVPLIPNVVLSSDAISQYPDYYHSLLEPLFFQVLNTPIEKRDKTVKHSFWNNVPFLNGGLFEPHLHDYYEIYYESGISKYISTLKIPDEWFLDLFKIFEIYNFTIDESTTIDVDISVDPEMLGRIFENLLAEINPQTGETARKSTGSYYTPRPIVEYMVDESLKQYLLTQVSASKDVIPVKTGIQKEKGLDSCLRRNDDNGIETKISQLLSYADSDIDLSEEEKDLIIDALDRVKIIDPACGSGAFPMGILHKMLLILQKIDPESKKWLTRKLARIDNKLLRKELESKLKSENWDYVHKLGIIQNSIYGVDIQSIAVEISKLRFFLSLIVDEKIDDKKPNRGVVPLPNLEFKFVAANSLIGLPKHEKETTIDFSEADNKVEELKKLREDYFTSIGEDKHKIEEEFLEKQKEMLVQVMNWQKQHKKSKDSQALKLSEWNPFADEAASWFDSEWMYGVKEGFDVVIGNPPYGLLFASDEKMLLRKLFPETQFKIDSYSLFILKAINLLKKYGTCSYIIPNTFLDNYFEEKVRFRLLKELSINEICDLSDKVFESAVVHSMILIFQNIRNEQYDIKISIDEQLNGRRELVPNQYFLQQDKCSINIRNFSVNDLLEKLNSNSEPLEKLLHIRQAIKTGNDSKYILNMPKKKNCKPILRGKDIQKWHKKVPNLYVDYGQHLACPRDVTIFEQPKILIREAGSEITATFDDENYYIMSSLYNCILIDKKYSLKYLLSLLNSKLFQYLMNKLTFEKTKGAFTKARIFHYYKLPIKILSQKEQEPFITLVDQILAAKQKDPNADTSALERQIDEMVYELYGLTEDERLIVEGEKN